MGPNMSIFLFRVVYPPPFDSPIFYPPKGDTQYLTRGSIDTLSIYCVSKSLEPFKNLTGFSIFYFLQMFYLMGLGGMGWDG